MSTLATTHSLALPQSWLKELGASPADVVWSYRYQIALSPREAWELLIDTSTLNCAIGLSAFETVERNAVAHAIQRHLGVVYEWTEPSWAWVEGQSIDALRIYRRGPGRHAVIRYAVKEHPNGSELTIEVHWWSRNALARVLLGIAGKTFRIRYARGIARMVAARRSGEPAREIMTRSAVHTEILDRQSHVAVQSGASERAIRALVQHLGTGTDQEVARIRPRVLARASGVSEREMLLACLHATRAGVLELLWDLVCPHCRGPRQTLKHLGDVPVRGTCGPCAIDFSTEPETAIEVTFSALPAVRDVRQRWHCVAEAATRRHVHVQYPLLDGEHAVLATGLAPGRYRARLRGELRWRALTVATEGAAAIEWKASEDSEFHCGPQPVLELLADRGQEELFVVEQIAWPDDAVHPAQLFNLQDFRDLFASEFVGADVQLSVGRQAVLFTDLVGSTRMYADRGDARAFVAVKKHFAIIFETVKQHDGAVVKTIGDAVMAAFFRPVDALTAAAAMIRDLAAAGDLGLEMRVSIHVGVCIAVQLNSGIDYFGQTVNLAAKLQSCAGARQIAFHAAMLEDPAVQQLLESTGASIERFGHRVEALDTNIDVARWTVRS